MSRRIASLFLILLVASPLYAATLTLAQYESALKSMRDRVAAGQTDAARAEAKSLAGSGIDSPNGRFQADSTLLAEVNAAKPRDLGVEARIDATLAALQSDASSKPATVDGALMRRLQREQTVPELPRGDDVHGLEVKDAFLKQLTEALQKAARWIFAKIVKFLDWLMRFWPDSGTKKPLASSGMRWTIGSLVALILIVLGVLAFEVIRRSRKAAPKAVEESAPLGSSRDDDPLSR
ncbi:MAG TPA: hypothetical protein VGO25_13595, partial [Rhodanobacteraceae bacterium]|nr:hypothetical protein [Rhodanobacteraceae bacterium]